MNSGLPGGTAERSDCFICVKKSQNAAYLAFLLLTQIHFGITFLAVNEGNQPHYYMTMLKSNTAEEVNQADLLYYSWEFPKMYSVLHSAIKTSCSRIIFLFMLLTL